MDSYTIINPAEGTNMDTMTAEHLPMPWEGIGRDVPAGLKATEAITTAGLDWTVSKHPVKAILAPKLAKSLGKREISVGRKFATIREDTGDVLGIVGSRYQIIQNAEAFGFMDAITSEMIRYQTLGYLNDGQRIWMAGKLPGSLGKGDDRIDKYLLFSNTHDGTGTVDVLWTPIRVVCANTLMMALRTAKASERVKIIHSGDLHEKLEQAQEVLGLAKRFYDDAEGYIKRLMGTHINKSQLEGYFKTLYPDPPEPTKPTKLGKQRKPRVDAERTRNRLTELFEAGPGADLPTARGTAWGAYNSVTAYLTHERPFKPRDRNETAEREGRFEANYFGSTRDKFKQAFQEAMALAN